jgi:hypothetical protein
MEFGTEPAFAELVVAGLGFVGMGVEEILHPVETGVIAEVVPNVDGGVEQGGRRGGSGCVGWTTLVLSCVEVWAVVVEGVLQLEVDVVVLLVILMVLEGTRLCFKNI